LERDSVANVSQIVAIDRALLERPAGHLSDQLLERILEGIDIVLDR
jgi:mRNA-degrading endonuclease toxin of MazEF toxin-antitoxin module